jgi:hypothetical protein
MSRCDTTVLATVDAEVEAKRIYGEQRANLLNRGFVAAVSGLWTIPAAASARGLVQTKGLRWRPKLVVGELAKEP